MRLTPWEEERLLVFTAAELARRHRAAGLPLNAPEAIALICDAMFEAARGGADYETVEAAGRSAVALADVMPGVRELVDEVRLEVLLGDGTRLIVLLDPIAGDPAVAIEPGSPGAIEPARDAERDVDESPEPPLELTVRSVSTRIIHVSSHYPFDRVNPRLEFDRSAARGYRLDIPAGASERWGPGETRTVRLVPYRGAGAEPGIGADAGNGAETGS
jgi:urease subunit gamma/beta